MKEDGTQNSREKNCGEYEIAKLSQGCQEKLKEFEKELNAQGCWNIALVAYQMKN